MDTREAEPARTTHMLAQHRDALLGVPAALAMKGVAKLARGMRVVTGRMRVVESGRGHAHQAL